jgi:tRNA/tmRNA/rRNA uracil-C5-methylase (TrmA/RlmC/RlmD family)
MGDIMSESMGGIIPVCPGDFVGIRNQAAGAGIDYDKAFEPGYCAELWQKIEKPLLETILRLLGGGERTVLDFACGSGRITKVAAMFFGSVVGVDARDHTLYSNHKALMTIYKAGLGNPCEELKN